MKESYKANWKLYNIIFIIIAVLVSVPLTLFWQKQIGLDPSWIYAMNKYLPPQKYVLGRDILFTHGPLGFLIFCMNVGHNVAIALIVWTLILASHIILLYQYLFKLKKGSNGLPVFLSLFLYTISNCGWNEYYLCYLALFSIMLVLNGYRKNIYLFNILLITSLYMKFSLFIMILLMTFVYLIFGYFYDQHLFKYCSGRILVAIIISPLIYFCFCGFSIINFFNYIKGSVELASGYNVAMSANWNDSYAIWIIVMIIAYLICIILGLRSGIYNFMTIAFVGVCLFMSYKHGFVRSDHMYAAMNGMLVFLSIIPAFLKWDRIFETIGNSKVIYIISMIVVIVIPVIQNGFNSVNIISQIRNKVFNLPYSIESVLDQDSQYLNPLPESILAKVGNASITIYPWEISYCISNNLNYVPLTTLQAYSIYTPYLDSKSAENLEGNEAPEFILLTLDTIDDRWPLIECPQTWEAIRNNYHIDIQEERLFLLKRNENITNTNYELIKTSTHQLTDIIELGEADYLKLDTRLSIKGNIAKIFWKIPEVNMRVYYSNGTEAVHRVLLDLFSEGVELGSLATTPETLINVLTNTENKEQLRSVSKIIFEGEGLKYYKSIFSVEYYKSN